MSVRFLTPPSVPPAEAVPELARASPGEPPQLLVVHAASARAWLAVLGRLTAIGLPLRTSARDPGAPLVAAWVAGPLENPEPLSLSADLILLGGGWDLLKEVLLGANRSRGLPRTARLERLARLPGVYVPALHEVERSEEGTILRVVPGPGATPLRGLGGSAPFESGSELFLPAHPRPEIQRLLGEERTPESLAGSVVAGEQVRLHFFVGLPGESGGGIVEWVKRFRHACVSRLRDERRLPRISVSLACYVPRPWTALQWWPMPPERALKAELARVTRGLRGIQGVTVTHDLPKWALLEGCLARGDRQTGWLFLLVHRLGWERAILWSPLNPAYILHRPRPADEPLPWDHVDWGIDRAGLRAQYEALLSALGEHG